MAGLDDEGVASIVKAFGGPKRKKKHRPQPAPPTPRDGPGFFASLISGIQNLGKSYPGVDTMVNQSTLDSGAILGSPAENTGPGRTDQRTGNEGVAPNEPPPRETTPRNGRDQRYWDGLRVSGAGQQASENLAHMNRNSDADSGVSDPALSNQEGTTMTRRNDANQFELWLGNNEGKLPRISFSKDAPEGFYNDPPSWVTESEENMKTLSELGTVKRRSDFTSPSAGDTVIQEVLAGLGYDPGGVDGRWGPATDAALRQFKNDNGLGDSATLDHTTREALKRSVRDMRQWADEVQNEGRYLN